MSLESDLLEIERALWSGGPEPYRRHLDERCLIAFTEMVGVYGREDVAATADGGDRWRDVDIEVEALHQPAGGVALLTYRAGAVRGEGERYRAIVTSGYVERDGAWKMMFHQQTPLPDA